MTYLFKDPVPFDGEIKNETGNPISVSKNTTVNSADNRIFVDTGLVIPPAFDGEIKNDSGNPIPVNGTVTANQGTTPWLVSLLQDNRIDNAPWNVLVGMGKVAGVTGLSISGYGPTIGTTFQPAWEGTTYTFPASAAQLRVWSASASDTNVQVKIDGLSSTYAPLSETVTLTNGITGVLTSGSFLRVNNISIVGNVQNVGEIRVGDSAKTNTLAMIGVITNITAGRSQMSIYTVPAGYTFFLTQSNWYTNQTGSQTALYRSWTRNQAGVVNIVLTFPMQQQYNSVKVVPRAYTEKTDIQWQVASSSGTSNIGGQIEGYLVSNSLLT